MTRRTATDPVKVRSVFGSRRVQTSPRCLSSSKKKWTDDQRADAAMLASRIAAFPALSVGAFCTRSGTAQASLFMKPTRHDHIRQCPTWADLREETAG